MLCFVRRSEQAVAEDIIEYWHKMCDLCSFYVRYVMFLVEDEYLFASHGEGNSEGLLRVAALKTQKYLDRLSVKSDVIVLLVGLNSMFGFIPPKSTEPNGHSIIPTCEYGSTAPYILPSALLLSSPLGEDHPLTWPVSIAGMTSALRKFLREILIKSPFHSGRQLSKVMSTYASELSNSHIVSWDSNRKYFSIEILTDQQIYIRLQEMFREVQMRWDLKVQTDTVKVGITHRYMANSITPKKEEEGLHLMFDPKKLLSAGVNSSG